MPFESFRGFIENKTGAAEIKSQIFKSGLYQQDSLELWDFLEKGNHLFLCPVCGFRVHADVNAGCDLARMDETKCEIKCEIMGMTNVLSRVV
jgi:hypothetical protein